MRSCRPQRKQNFRAAGCGQLPNTWSRWRQFQHLLPRCRRFLRLGGRLVRRRGEQDRSRRPPPSPGDEGLFAPLGCFLSSRLSSRCRFILRLRSWVGSVLRSRRCRDLVDSQRIERPGVPPFPPLSYPFSALWKSRWERIGRAHIQPHNHTNHTNNHTSAFNIFYLIRSARRYTKKKRTKETYSMIN